jgi:hypothetical protein
LLCSSYKSKEGTNNAHQEDKGIYQKEYTPGYDRATYTSTLIAALFTTAMLCKEPHADEWIKKTHTHTYTHTHTHTHTNTHAHTHTHNGDLFSHKE